MALQRKIAGIENELNFISEYYKKGLLDLRGEIDRLKLDIAALRAFLENALPDFGERFPEIYEKTMLEVNPEVE
jgi:predicted translin family RNA/ssDNA-binding protein